MSHHRRACSRLPRAIAVAVPLAFAVAAGVVSPAAAQKPGATISLTGRIVGHDSLVVSVLTMGQGEELFDRFGHQSVRVRNLTTGLDSAWNWGMYDFNSPNFIPRFLTGETRYWMAGFPSDLLIDYYRRSGRAVWEQELSLNAQEADSLLTYLRWNARPENKFYRYDYYRDNCATRLRDLIDGVLHGELKRTITGVGHGVTWRGETIRLADEFPIVGFAMSFALGTPADATLSAWEEMFIPMRLRDAIRPLKVRRAGEPERPLVNRETELVPVGAYVEAPAPRSFLVGALTLGISLALAILLIGNAATASTAARNTIRVLGVTWHFVAGVSGTLVLLAGLMTRHVFMAANTGVLLGTPVSLALMVLMIPAWSRNPDPRRLQMAATLSLFTFGAASLALVSHAAPSFSPADLSAVAFALPVHAAFAYLLRVRATVVTAGRAA
jgi:hypothetical protein